MTPFFDAQISGLDVPLHARRGKQQVPRTGRCRSAWAPQASRVEVEPPVICTPISRAVVIMASCMAAGRAVPEGRDIGVDRVDGGLLDAHRGPVGIQLLRRQHGEGGVDALPHLLARHPRAACCPA